MLVPLSWRDAVPILSQAFADDPAMTFFTAVAPLESQALPRTQILDIIARLHELSRQRLWGWRIDDQVVGCALVEARPNRLRQGAAMLRALPSALRLPSATLSRLNAYVLRSQRGRPKGLTHFLTLLGMSDLARGRGHGTRFLDALHAHYGPTAHWALDTETPDNLSFYERLGYHPYSTEELGPVTMFKLHRPPRSQGA
jgi:GNAT superfamily N-acetyltransferase